MSSISICKLRIEDVAQYLEVLRNLTVVKTDLNTAKLIYEKELLLIPYTIYLLHILTIINVKGKL